MAQAGHLQLSAGTLDFCLGVVGSAQWAVAELLSLQWVAAGCLWAAAGSVPQRVAAGSLPQRVAAGSVPQRVAAGSVPQRVAASSLPQRVAAGSLPAVSPPLPAGSRLPSLTHSPQDYPCLLILANVD